jgi:hypothetical protein
MLPKINQNCPSPGDPVGRARELAARAEALASAISTLHNDIRAAHDASVHRAGFRCDTAIGCAREAARELRDTASDLDRIAAAALPGTCAVPWGVCPEHGNTLTSNGGRTWCRDAHCDRTWSYDHVGLPCTEPVRWTVTDQDGDTVFMCDSHALDATKRLDGAQAAPLPSSRKSTLKSPSRRLRCVMVAYGNQLLLSHDESGGSRWQTHLSLPRNLMQTRDRLGLRIAYMT